MVLCELINIKHEMQYSLFYKTENLEHFGQFKNQQAKKFEVKAHSDFKLHRYKDEIY